MVAFVKDQELVKQISATMHACNRHPRMGDMYRRYYDEWAKIGGDMFAVFSSIGQYSNHGAWGLGRVLRQPTRRLSETRRHAQRAKQWGNPWIFQAASRSIGEPSMGRSVRTRFRALFPIYPGRTGGFVQKTPGTPGGLLRLQVLPQARSRIMSLVKRRQFLKTAAAWQRPVNRCADPCGAGRRRNRSCSSACRSASRASTSAVAEVVDDLYNGRHERPDQH